MTENPCTNMGLSEARNLAVQSVIRVKKGALRMNRWVGLLRGLGLAGLVLGGVAFGGALSVTSVADRAYAQTASSIVVQGNRRVEADTIRSYFPPGRLDARALDDALKALYQTGLFQDVRITPSGGRVVVTVVENAVINRVAFEGNSKVKDEQLVGEVQSRSRGTLSRPTVQSDTQRIVEIYRRNGRFDVRVEPKIIELPNNRVDLVFEINEGEKTSVRSITFVGNNSFSATRLRDEIRTSYTFLPGFLSFLQSNDIYDADRLEADRDLLRRFYLKKGFADVRIVSAVGEYDPGRQGFVVTFTIDEGQQYRFGTVDIQSNVPAIEPGSVRSTLRTGAGTVYNAELVEKSVENLAIEAARRGYPFAVVRPRGDRDPDSARINLVYVLEEGPRVYIERINVRGNTRTRDYVIRREFDLAEGDAFNRALVDRAERRLKNLNYFKSVRITNEPGSAPDRVVLNVDVDEQPTGEMSVAGGYSTADGFMGEVSVGERNLLGRGQYARAAIQYGQRARGFELSFAEPFFLGYRLAAGIDVFAKQTLASSFYSYDNEVAGGNLRLGFALSEELSFQARYSAYQQNISLPSGQSNCTPTPTTICASLPVRKELADGRSLVSLVGYTLAYNTLDNNKNPTSGILAELKQDFAGVGGDVNFIRSTADVRSYYEVFSDVVAVVRLQGGHLGGWGSKDLRMLDHFQMGPNLVRGFATAGIGPRDMTANTTQDAVGGTMYWGASVEAQTPFHFIPRDVGIKGAVFADAGSLWGYKGPTAFTPVGGAPQTMNPLDSDAIRASVGVGLIWNSPFGPLRFDYAIPLMKQGEDRVQQFRFGGGTRF
jgi:outer membrane protein insertion porin family